MEHLNGQIETEIILMDETYEISVEMPTGRPIYEESDYKLTIYSEKVRKETPKDKNVNMLAHIVASFDKESDKKMPENFYLHLSPPADILPTVKNAKGETTFAINSLSIKFSTGKYTTNPKIIPGSVSGNGELVIPPVEKVIISQ